MNNTPTTVEETLANQSGAETDPADHLVDAQGRSVRRMRTEARNCPRCGAGGTRRVASAGFGSPHPVCGRCGHEFISEAWEGGTR